MKQYKEGVFFSDKFVGENSWNGYERKCLFANIGNGQFMDVARPTGSDSIKDGRGVAIADFNGDGKLDLVINNNNAAPTVYLNEVKRRGNSVVIKLEGIAQATGNSLATNRDAIGAQVRLTIVGKTMMRRSKRVLDLRPKECCRCTLESGPQAGSKRWRLPGRAA